jgi:TPR repeat protein
MVELSFLISLDKARAGDVAFQLHVAKGYFLGQGVPVDERLAADWYEKAAKQGNATAQTELAGMYWNGLGRLQNRVCALTWYRKAAEQNYARASSTLGYLYEKGEDVPQDDDEAAYWYKRSFEFTDHLLGLPDHEEIFWLRRARANDPVAQTIIGRMFESGFGRKQSYNDAREWYGKAADQNCAEAQQRLARMLLGFA